ncbi:MAG: phosphoglycerate dehydrogenase [Candidatus Omnitrophota bacterium]
MSKIAITTSSFGEYDRSALDLLKEKGLEVALNPYGRKLVKREIIEICGGAMGLVAGTETLDRDTMKDLKGLRVISRCGTGMDNVDLEAADDLGIKVYNTPDGPTLAVAELTVALMLNLIRKVSASGQDLKNGKWDKRMGNLLSGKKIGIVGFGRIGKKTAGLLRPFGCLIKYADPFLSGDVEGFEGARLEELLAWADIVSLHVSNGEEILGEKEMLAMKKGAWLLNMSRGGVVNEEALFKALGSGHLSGAALDVFKKEPYDGPLRKLDNVVLTPHIGSYAKEARVKMEYDAVQNLLKGLGV